MCISFNPYVYTENYEPPEAEILRLKKRMQLMWGWMEAVNERTDIKIPEHFLEWFDDNGKPL